MGRGRNDGESGSTEYLLRTSPCSSKPGIIEFFFQAGDPIHYNHTDSVEPPSLPVGKEIAALRSVLKGMEALTSPSILGPAGWSAIRNRARGMPIDPGRIFGFEVRLSERRPSADFIVSTSSRDPLADFLIARGGRSCPGSPEAALGAYLAKGLQTDEPAAQWWSTLFVEFDIEDDAQFAEREAAYITNCH